MKRSEMISLIHSIVFNDPFNDDVAIIILDQIEAVGMAPPEIREPVETLYLDAKGNAVRGEDSTLFVRKWESE